MGRLVKHQQMIDNVGVANSTLLPGGSTAQRPDSPEEGALRYNTNNNAVEFYDGTTWQQGGTAGLVPVTKDSFVGDAATTTFVMSIAVTDETDALVFVGGVFQNPGVSYTNDGSTTITFTSPPPNLEAIVVLHGLNSTI